MKHVCKICGATDKDASAMMCNQSPCPMEPMESAQEEIPKMFRYVAIILLAMLSGAIIFSFFG